MVVQPGEIPPSPVERKAPRVDQAALSSVPELDPLPRPDRGEGRRGVIAGFGLQAHCGSPPGVPTGGSYPVVDGTAELPQSPGHGLATPVPVQLDRGRGQAQRGQLRLVEAGIGELVEVAGYPVPLFLVAGPLTPYGDERKAHLAEKVLVSLEVAPEGIRVVRIAVDAGADLRARQRLRRVDQRRHQVHQALEAVHAFRVRR